MSLHIAQIIAERDATVLARASEDMPFADGTQGPQVAHHTEALRRILTLVERRLNTRDTFRTHALPAAIGGMQLVRIGAETGAHTFQAPALIGALRADLTFVMPLSARESYEGGAIAVDGQTVDLAPGDALVVEASRPMSLSPVTSGTLLLVCGYVQSHVPQPDRRETLHALTHEIETLKTAGTAGHSIAGLSTVHANLLRMWATG